MATGSVDELVGRVRAALGGLRFISEAPTSRALDVTTGSASSESPLPGTPGSLFDHHTAKLEEWLVQVEHDVARRRLRAPGAPPAEDAKQWARRVVATYEGFHPLDVAIRENTSQTQVRRMRKQHNRDTLWGRPLPEEEKGARRSQV